MNNPSSFAFELFFHQDYVHKSLIKISTYNKVKGNNDFIKKERATTPAPTIKPKNYYKITSRCTGYHPSIAKIVKNAVNSNSIYKGY